MPIFGGKKISEKEQISFLQHLATMASIGGSPYTWVATWTPLTHAGQRFQKKVLYHLGAGRKLSEALRYTDTFSVLEIETINLGEISGELDKKLQLVLERKEKHAEFKSRLKSKLMIPAFEVFLVIVAICIIVYFVIPRFESFVEATDLRNKLPYFSQKVFATAKWLRHWLPAFPGIAFLAGLFFYKKIIKNPYTLLTLPKVNIVVKYRLYTLIFGYLATLVEAGVDLSRAFNIMLSAFHRDPLTSTIIRRVIHFLDRGFPLTEALGNVKFRGRNIFDKEVISSVSIAEQAGQIVSICSKMSQTYEELFDRTLDNLTSLITPVIVVIVAGVVAFMIVGVMLPIFQISFSIMGG